MEKCVPSSGSQFDIPKEMVLDNNYKKNILPFDFQMFDKMETLLFARKMELVDSLISVFNGVLINGYKGENT